MNRPNHRSKFVHTLLATLFAAPFALSGGCDDDADIGESPAEPEAPGAEAPAEADDASELPLRDGEERFGEGVTRFVEADVAGTRFAFVRIDDPATGRRSLGLLEVKRPGGISLALEPALKGASLRDVFLAVTGEDVALPEELRALDDHELGPRGWIAEKAARGEYQVPRALCVNADFQSALTGWDPAVATINGTPVWNLDSSPPGTDWGYAAPAGGCGGCDPMEEGWSAFMGGDSDWAAENVDAVKQRVEVCNIAYHPSLGGFAHEGPDVRFVYRTEGSLTQHTAWSRDLLATDEGNAYQWYWEGAVNPGDNNSDWKIKIGSGRDLDLFDIGVIPDAYGW